MITDKRETTEYRVHVHEVFAYESSRKRMSIVVELSPETIKAVGGVEAIRIYTKGADSVVLDLLRGGTFAADPSSAEAVALNGTLDEWANIALRTLVFGKREVPPAVWEAWRAAYEIAKASQEDIAKMRAGEPNRITDLQVELESELTLQGATAIEDKLQDGVPEILADLRLAGVKIWMLTGDKVGTAKNIAMACNILTQDAERLELTTETHPVLNRIRASSMIEINLLPLTSYL